METMNSADDTDSPKSSRSQHIYAVDSEDAIECIPWLEEIGMVQYAKTFLANFPYNGVENYISFKKLSQLRLQDFPRMNITNYEHQRALFDHIKKKEISDCKTFIESLPKMKCMSSNRDVLKNGNDSTPGSARVKDSGANNSNSNTVHLPSITKKPPDSDSKIPRSGRERAAGAVRRRTFDNNAWQSISKLRTRDQAAQMLDSIRKGTTEVCHLMVYLLYEKLISFH